MASTKIKAVVFDLGNVLIPFDYDIMIDKLNKIEAGLGSKMYKLYLAHYDVHRLYEAGKMTDEEFLSTVLKWADFKLNKEEFCHIYSDVFTVNEDVTGLLPQLKEQYKLVLLSNTNHIHQKYGWAKYDFLNNFDKLILSHEVGAVKPEEKIYRAVEAYTGEPPEAHFYTDDVDAYVKAAENLGWDAVQFKNGNQLKEAMQQRGLL